MHARYVARSLTPPQHLTCAVITVGHFVRRVGSRLQRSIGAEDDTGHSAGVKKRRTTLMYSTPTPAVNITFSNPSSFQAVKEGNRMILFDGWCGRQFWYSVTEYVSVDIDDSLIPANGIHLRCSQLPFLYRKTWLKCVAIRIVRFQHVCIIVTGYAVVCCC